MYYSKHIFICTNQKAEGKRCCAQAEYPEAVDYLKSKLKALKLYGPDKIRVSRSGCLGRCTEGPCLLIYPEGVWYRYTGEADLDSIVEQHLLANKIIQSLRLS